MANTIYSQGNKIEYGIKTFVVDTEEDKTNLSIRSAKMGSKCYVMGTKKWYILNGSFEWDPFVDAGGSGGSGSPFVPKGSVATVNDLPTEDNTVGDLYIVQEDHSEWVWLTSTEEPDGYWEQLGSAILPSDIVEASEQMTDAQAAQMLKNLGGAGELFIITVTPPTHPGWDWNFDHNWNEVYAALQAGKDVRYKIDDVLSSPVVFDEDNGIHLLKAVIAGSWGTQKNYNIWMTDSGLAGNVVTAHELVDAPAVTASRVVTATSQMTAQQQSDTRDNIDADPKKMVVTITYDEDNDTLSVNKTFTEISEAIEEGRTVICIDDDGGRYSLLGFHFDDILNIGYVAFSNATLMLDSTNSIVVRVIKISSSDDVFLDNLAVGTPVQRDISGATPTITPISNSIYNCGTLTSLTISNPPSTGSYSIVFTSGSTATTTTIPSTILGLENFAAEANTLYEINVLDNRAVVGSWAVSSS